MVKRRAMTCANRAGPFRETCGGAAGRSAKPAHASHVIASCYRRRDANLLSNGLSLSRVVVLPPAHGL